MASTDAHTRITLTEHDIILVQREQKIALAEALRPAAALSDAVIDGLSAEDARHTLKVYAALARKAIRDTRMEIDSCGSPTSCWSCEQ